jgi:hypothetical protein
MSDHHVRATNGARVVVVLSTFLHTGGRTCKLCNALWTAKIDANKEFHAWRNGVQADSAILDWTGNNVAVECCPMNRT